MVDLFAGAGGLTLGFYKNGFEIVATSEIDKWAVETYNYNFKTNIISTDITEKKTKDNLLKIAGKNIDLLIGGFPCQGFSIAGRRDPNDIRNKLYLDTISVIKSLQPKVFVLENVKGILSMESGKRIKEIMKDLNKNGYFSEYVLLNSSDFGVPQNRERVIFIGSKDKGKVQETIKTLKKIKLDNKKTVKDAIEDLMKKSNDENFNHVITKHTEKTLERLSKLKEGESLYENYKDSWKKVWWNKPSPTVKENHGATNVHPRLNRVMTARELARLQSFPDSFIFKGPKSAQLRQIGNAVPVGLSFGIAKVINDIFFESENK
ncbi:DNA cytosine methyltransferase [Mesoplasma florum]|uniref:DNA cytosine methyltransferase n=1 Tax=Mesoplasma florum TaxID=2151 RepID=UPI0018E09431|nr:DNA cytosine methyltransferase [Mesoplasma florum]